MKSRKVTVSQPVIVAQSTTERIMHGGYQAPFIRCDENGVLYIKFAGRRDCPETLGLDDKNPVYKSLDQGQTWERTDHNEWISALPKLPNGDRFSLGEKTVVTDFPQLPELPANREKTATVPTASIAFGVSYTVDELKPILGDKIKKTIKAYRIPAGQIEPVEEECTVHWENMPIHHVKTKWTNHLWMYLVPDQYTVDKNGTLWWTTTGAAIAPDGSMLSKRLCVHLLRSDDFGHNWHYVSTVLYKEEYNTCESLYGLEGFDEATLQILDDGTFIMLMRVGSLCPTQKEGPEDKVMPLYYARSTDQGKTWSEVRPFYDYGIRPGMVKLGCGTLVMISGRPDVYIRTCDDPAGQEWNEVIHLIDIPAEDRAIYYEYTCSNTGICAYDDHTAFVAYGNFQLNTPEGIRAKSILVSKITVE